MKTLTSAVLGILVASCANAFASSTQWVEAEGGRVRLVTSGTPDANGRLEGILDIHLDPGWKTYWRDPGEAGVPPSLDISGSKNIKSATLDFPAPQRHDDGYSIWAGYDRSVALPIVFHVDAPGKPASINADIFLGICQSICIPVRAKLTLDPARAPTDAADAESVAAAFKDLPKAAGADFGVTVVSRDDRTVLFEARSPGDTDRAEFFIAAADGYTFAVPKREEKDGKTFFSVEILDRPATKPAEGGIHYTLETGNGAVSGLLPYF